MKVIAIIFFATCATASSHTTKMYQPKAPMLAQPNAGNKSTYKVENPMDNGAIDAKMPTVKDTAKTPVRDDTVDVQVPTYPTPSADTRNEEYEPRAAPGGEKLGVEKPIEDSNPIPEAGTPIGDKLPRAKVNKSMNGDESSSYSEDSSSRSETTYINGLDGEQESTNAIGNTAAVMTVSAVLTCLVAMSSAMLL